VEQSMIRRSRDREYGQKATLILITGEKDSGKKPIAKRLEASVCRRETGLFSWNRQCPLWDRRRHQGKTTIAGAFAKVGGSGSSVNPC